MVAQQLLPVQQQVVEIHDVHLDLARLVEPKDPPDLVGSPDKMLVLLLEDLLDAALGVDAVAVDVAQHLGLRKVLVSRLDVGFAAAVLHQRLGVLDVEDGVVGLVAEPVGLPA